MTAHTFSTYGVIGLGLMGGSVAKALRHTQPKAKVFGIDPDAQCIHSALSCGAINEGYTQLDEALEDCDVVFVCSPLATLPEIFEGLARLKSTEVIITDVAGCKGIVESWASQHLSDRIYVGSHPMAGGEQGGFSASRRDLFFGFPVAICSASNTFFAAEKSLGELWRQLGAVPINMPSQRHDEIVAHTSHVPYVCAMAQVTLGSAVEGASTLVGRGYTDATRHALFPPEIMGDVVANNPQLGPQLRKLSAEIEKLAKIIESNDDDAIRAYAQQAQQLRFKTSGTQDQ